MRIGIRQRIHCNEGKMGNEDAPITIMEFTHYQCVDSGTYIKEIFQLLQDAYIHTARVCIRNRNSSISCVFVKWTIAYWLTII